MDAIESLKINPYGGRSKIDLDKPSKGLRKFLDNKRFVGAQSLGKKKTLNYLQLLEFPP
jgi:hypothetical protein